jgi:hypothetical protein
MSKPEPHEARNGKCADLLKFEENFNKCMAGISQTV